METKTTLEKKKKKKNSYIISKSLKFIFKVVK